MKRIKIFTKVVLVGLFMTVLNQSCTNLDEEVYSEVTPDNFFQDEDQFIADQKAAWEANQL